MAIIFPSLDNINRLKVSPTSGELFLINYLIKNLSDEVEIYFQPFINGDRPDFVLIQKDVGVSIIEVKDWNLNSYKLTNDNEWYLSKNHQKIKSPIHQVEKYKENLFSLHINGLLESKIKNSILYGRIKTYVYFHNETKSSIETFCKNSTSNLKIEITELNNNFKSKNIDFNTYEKNCNKLNKKLEKIENDFRYSLIAKDNIDKITLPHSKSPFFNEDLYNEFKRYLQPPFHTKEEGKKINYTSKQIQLSTSSAIHEKIKGIAGCGKTTVLAKRAVNAYKRHGDTILILTYNITLINYIRDRISDVRENFRWDKFYIINYHEFFSQIANELGINIEIPTEILNKIAYYSTNERNEFIENYYEEKYYSNIDVFNNSEKELGNYVFKTILIDEIQDYKAEWIKIIRKYFTNKTSELVLFGDDKQAIYKDKINNDNKIKVIQGFGTWKELSKPIRYIEKGSRITKLAEKFQQANFIGKYELDIFENKNQQLELDFGIYRLFDYKIIDRKHNYELVLDYDEITKEIFNEIKKNDVHPNDIVILSSRIHIVREIDFLIRTKYKEKTLTTFETKEQLESNDILKTDIKNLRRIKKVHFNLNPGFIKLSTIHSFKGFESPTVFLIIHPDDNEELIYTAFTRSKFNLMIFINKESRFYNFFNMELNRKKNSKDDNVINVLKDAINKKRIINFEYEINGNIKYQKEIKPYKILFMNDNYYLAAEVNNEFRYSMFRVDNISEVTLNNNEFEFDYDLLDFIVNIQTPFAKYRENYKEHLLKVIVEIDKSKTKFFGTKKFLPSQEILAKQENGNFLISFEVTQELEIEDLVKKWIPFIKVIEPLTLKDKIIKDLKIYLEKNQSN